MALSRKTKKLLKGYASWKALKTVAKFGALPAAGVIMLRLFGDRDHNARS